MRTKLTLLLLISIFIFGCTKPNPHLGKWQPVDDDGRNIVVEILEGGNWIQHFPGGKMTAGQWLGTEGGIVITIDGYSLTAFVYEGSLLLTDEDETFTLKRVK